MDVHNPSAGLAARGIQVAVLNGYLANRSIDLGLGKEHGIHGVRNIGRKDYAPGTAVKNITIYIKGIGALGGKLLERLHFLDELSAEILQHLGVHGHTGHNQTNDECGSFPHSYQF